MVADQVRVTRPSPSPKYSAGNGPMTFSAPAPTVIAARVTVAPPTPAWVTVGVTVCEDPSAFFTWMRVLGPALNWSPDAAEL